MIEMVQVAPLQNESCTDVSAYPPALPTLMSWVTLSDVRLTWYSFPLYAP
jgi:hypothetical protein